MNQITTARQLFDAAVLESADVSAKQVLESGATHIAMDADRSVFTFKMNNGFPEINNFVPEMDEHYYEWLAGQNGRTVHYIGEVPEAVEVDCRTACFPIPNDFDQVK